MITDTDGDLLDDRAEALVNGVNIGGVMGRSLAGRFKRRFPEMFREYERMARRGELQMGRVHVWATGEEAPRFVVNLPTKRHWRSKARRADVEQGLADLARAVTEHGITSVAVPALGCGSGGLEWSEVRPLVEAAFAPFPHVEVRLYAPRARSAPTPDADPRRAVMTPGRTALVATLHRYEAVTTQVTVLEVEKLSYFLQEAGQDLRLTFTDGATGPISDDLRHALAPLDGAVLTGSGDGTDRAAVVELPPGVGEEAVVAAAATSAVASRVDRVLALARGFESPYGLELLATLHWAVTRDERAAGDPERAAALVVEERERAARMFTEAHVAAAVAHLSAEGWFGPRRPVPVGARA